MLDLSKPIVDESGREVRIICTDRISEAGYNIVALAIDDDGDEIVRIFKKDGTGVWGKQYRNAPEVTKKYARLFKSGSVGYSHDSIASTRLDKLKHEVAGMLVFTLENGEVVKVEFDENTDL